MRATIAPADGRPQPRSATLRWAAFLLAPWKGHLAVVAFLVIAAAGLELVPPLVIKWIIDEHLTVGKASGLLPLSVLYLAATATVEGAGFLYTYLTAVVAQGTLHRLRVQLFTHLQQLPLSFHDRTSLGDVISRCTADVETVDTLFSAGVTKVLGDLVRLATTATAMVLLSLPLALIAGLTVPPIVLVTHVFRVRVRDAERANRRAIGELNTQLQETIGGIEVIRAFCREAAFVQRFRRALRTALAAFNRATFYAAVYPPTMALLAAVTTALLLWAATRQVFTTWEVSLGTLTGFVLLFQRFFKPITALGDEWQTVQAAFSGLERILDVLALPGEEPAPKSDRAGASRHQESSPIALEQVVFGYLPAQPVLRDLSLVVQAGEHVALVGRTGAGKSSLLHLAGGLYAPWSGTVRVMGEDPRALDEEERRRVIGVVPQVVQLFSATVLENLTLGDAGVPMTTVHEAARVAGAHELIESLPQGYATALVGSGRGRGMHLSAGQRQLLALARALVWRPHVLLLDEATAAIDAASDAAFRAALRQWSHGRGGAVLSVAHRLSTAREADRVVVLDAGRIVEMGAPATLIRQGGRFAGLVELEAAGWEWQRAPQASTGVSSAAWSA